MCKVTAQMIVADGTAVAQALNNLAEAVQPTDPSLATKLADASTAISQATANWQTGSPLADIEDAEQAAIAVLNAIPLTAPYASLVAIAFAALNILIANGQSQSQLTGEGFHDAKTLLAKADSINTDSPWFNKATIKHHFLNPPRKDFESAWNSAATPLGVKTVTM